MTPLFVALFSHYSFCISFYIFTCQLFYLTLFFPFPVLLFPFSATQLCVKIFENRGHQVDFKPTVSEEELIKTIGEYEGMVVRSATKVISSLCMCTCITFPTLSRSYTNVMWYLN